MSPAFSALLLVGGKSSRMGTDKAFLQIEGSPLWQRQLRLFESLGAQQIFLAGPERPEWQLPGCEVLADTQPDAGPLAGLVAGLRVCTTPLLLALAVDLPRMTAPCLRGLLDLCRPDLGVVPVTDRIEPLAAIYPVAALSLAEEQLSRGHYSLTEFARRCVENGLLLEHTIEAPEAALFLNLNTSADLITTMTSRVESILRLTSDSPAKEQSDELAVEEPLELRIEGHSVAVMMRTPGHDRELAAGFLLTENLVRNSADIFEISLCGATSEDQVVNVTLRDPRAFDPARLTRNVFSSSSCGVCSKATLEAVRQTYAPINDASVIARAALQNFPAVLRREQQTFNRTGGLHACGLFDLNGNLEVLREDVGRHNALDKLIGHELLANRLPARGRVLFLSGRVSFEMMQKALAAGFAIVAAISAPTSLAVEFARANNQTLVGFVRDETMNVYAGAERVG